MKLKNKVCVVTGGANGIGQATVEKFLSEGAKVVIADFNEKLGQDVCVELKDRGYKNSVKFVKTDVRIENDIKNLFTNTCETFGGLDAIFNNAGVIGAVGPLWDLDEEDWDYTFDVLVKGVFFGIKHAARIFRKQKRSGVILNTSSVAGLNGGCGPLAYSTSKAAVINLTRSAAVQLAQDKVRVNAICPGYIYTGLTIPKTDTVSEGSDKLSIRQPIQDHGTPNDIASAAVFLCSDDSRFISGEALVIDGALTALGPDLWNRAGIPYERDMSSKVLNRGTTGESHVKKPLNKSV